jgi:hypothetical protein
MLKTGVQERQAISVRRSGRIAIRIPVEVSGLDRHGADFEETAFTTTVSRHGAAVSILRSLKPEQEIRIRRAKGNIDSVFRVVGQIGLHNLDNVYGVARENAGTDVWGITFPENDSSEMLANILLECRRCSSREVVGMIDIELEVFKTNGHIVRNCKTCFEQTDWLMVPDDLTTDASPQRLGSPRKPSSNNSRAVNRRKHKRVNMELTACIRGSGHNEEFVYTADISKGGMRFLSKTDYSISSWVEVAVPYVDGSANIYMAARIVRVQESKKAGFREYGIEYAPQR